MRVVSTGETIRTAASATPRAIAELAGRATAAATSCNNIIGTAIGDTAVPATASAMTPKITPSASAARTAAAHVDIQP